MLAVAAFAASLGWYGYRHFWADRGVIAAEEAAGGSAGNAPAVPVRAPGPTSSGLGPGASKPASEPPARPAQANPAGPAAKSVADKPVAEKPASEKSASGEGAPPRAADAPATAATPPAPGSPPAFDVVRVEPTGETVVAGRASPGATVELMVNGQRQARVVADPSGLFALVPDPLPSGSHELVLQVRNGDGPRIVSAQTVTVVVADNRRDAPLVTVTAPGQPAVVLSRPDEPAKVAASDPPPSRPAAPAPKPASKPEAAPVPPQRAGETPASATAPARTAQQPAAPAKARPPIQIASVEVEGAGRLLVSANAAPAATVRLYLNDSFIAPAAAGSDGRVAFAIERGIQPGSYRVRLDDIDPVSGQVRSRAEVPFDMPAQVMPAQVADKAPPPSAATPRRESTRIAAVSGEEPIGAAPPAAADPSPDRTAAAGGPVAPGGMPPPPAPAAPVVVVPAVSTTTVARGDSLWAISHRTYGDGWRYTVIYGANANQIRNPHLIYPGQIFVLPTPSPEIAKH